jgi:uncharacterized protein (DUF885 family)
MTMNRREALAVGAAALFAAHPALAQDASGRLKTVFDGIVAGYLKESPETCTSLAIPEAMAGGKYQDKLGDRSAAGVQRRAGLVKDAIRQLDAIDPAGLSARDRISRDVVRSAMGYFDAGARFGYGDYGPGGFNPYVVDQLNGAYTGLPDFLDAQHPIRNAGDADDYLARVAAYAKVLDEETDRVKADDARGVRPPDFAVDRALGLLQTFALKAPEDTVLAGSLARRGKDLPGAAARQRDVVRLVRDSVLPAYRRQIGALQTLRPRATSNAGVWALPDGEAYYAASLAMWTTTGMSADEVHALGLDQVRRLNAEMDAGLKKLGLTRGTVGARMRAMGQDPRFLYPNDDAGKAKLLADLNDQMAALEKRLPEVFRTLPKAKVEVRRIPPFTEAGAPGGYYQAPALDGSRPGAYYINLRDTADWPRWSLPTLTYHEAEPGHHLQIAISQEAQGLPLIRSSLLWFGGYGEGWALYAEQLADEIGMYADDPHGRLGYLQSMAFRAARCVVDTGLHAKRWSRDRAIAYMQGVTGDTLGSVTTEIERYCVWPAQATCYKVGQIAINRMRDAAKARMGARFDLKGFHDAVLLEGAMPLDVLEKVVDGWSRSA